MCMFRVLIIGLDFKISQSLATGDKNLTLAQCLH